MDGRGSPGTSGLGLPRVGGTVRPVKILFLSDLWVPFPGGAERLQFNLARDLMRRGEQVVALTGYAYSAQFDGPPVFQDLGFGVFDQRDAGGARVAHWLDEIGPDVVVTHHLYANQFERELVAYGRPFVQVVLNGRRLPTAAMGVHISKWVRDRAHPHVEDMTITPPVFDDVVAETHEHAVGFIKPIEHKGVDTVYRVAEAHPDRRFVVLRGEWQDLEIIREDLPNVEYLEPVADIRDFYRRVDVVLMPSKSEDAGTVGQECALNGIPCVSSNVDGLAETNAGGVLLDPGDVTGFIRTVERLDDPEVRALVVERMVRALAAKDQDGQLAEFHRRLVALA